MRSTSAKSSTSITGALGIRPKSWPRAFASSPKTSRRKKDSTSMATLLIDNYDSFTYNLYQFLNELGAEVVVVRNDQATIEECLQLGPDHVVISPGPGDPTEA